MDTFPNAGESERYRIESLSDLAILAKELRAKDKLFLSQYEKVILLLDRQARQSRVFLDISNSNLTEFPHEITLFRDLLELRLANNSLASMPEEIAKLTKLKRLSLDNNLLVTLPAEMGLLKELEVLSLRNNRLRSLPEEIGNLGKLRKLDVSDNCLQRLPSATARLSDLREINLHGNSFPPIPPEIASKMPLEIVTFIMQVTAEGARSISEAKVLFVGEGGVGKTSLVKRLIDGEFDEYELKTDGILIRKWQVSAQDRSMQLNVWDFGGQEIMHATHQFFLTERSLYVVVWDARREDDYGQLEYWLNVVQSFSNGAPIIVVLNKTDVGRTEIDRRFLKRKFPSIKEFVNCSCKNRFGVADLREFILWYARQLPHVTTVWPKQWFQVKDQLERTNRDYLSLADYEQLCSGAIINGQDDRDNLLQFLHDLGIVLSFHQDARLCDTNVLNPEWATGGVYKILNDQNIYGLGILHISDIARILDDVRYPREKHRFIINLMEKFELCYPIDDEDRTRFLIPDLLSKQEPFYKWDFRYSLAFQYQYNFLPGSVISRFIVRVHSFIDRNLVWRNGVILRDGSNRALVLADITARKIFIYVDGLQTTRRDLLAKIRMNFDHIHGTIRRIEASAKVPFSEDQNIVVDYQHLLELEALGEEDFIPEGLRRRVKVWEFLHGVETRDTRRRRKVIMQADEKSSVDVTIVNSVKGMEIQSMTIDKSQSIKAGRDVSISDSQVMLEKIGGDAANCIDSISGNPELKRLLQNLHKIINDDLLLPEKEKSIALKKTGLLAQVASKAVEATEGLIEDTIRGIKGTLVEGSTHLFESGKELLLHIRHLLPI